MRDERWQLNILQHFQIVFPERLLPAHRGDTWYVDAHEGEEVFYGKINMRKNTTH